MTNGLKTTNRLLAVVPHDRPHGISMVLIAIEAAPTQQLFAMVSSQNLDSWPGQRFPLWYMHSHQNLKREAARLARHS